MEDLKNFINNGKNTFYNSKLSNVLKKNKYNYEDT